jgi:hypothetical protein
MPYDLKEPSLSIQDAVIHPFLPLNDKKKINKSSSIKKKGKIL